MELLKKIASYFSLNSKVPPEKWPDPPIDHPRNPDKPYLTSILCTCGSKEINVVSVTAEVGNTSVVESIVCLTCGRSYYVVYRPCFMTETTTCSTCGINLAEAGDDDMVFTGIKVICMKCAEEGGKVAGT